MPDFPTSPRVALFASFNTPSAWRGPSCLAPFGTRMLEEAVDATPSAARRCHRGASWGHVDPQGYTWQEYAVVGFINKATLAELERGWTSAFWLGRGSRRRGCSADVRGHWKPEGEEKAWKTHCQDVNSYQGHAGWSRNVCRLAEPAITRSAQNQARQADYGCFGQGGHLRFLFEKSQDPATEATTEAAELDPTAIRR
ncbi:hypothetical protein N658DRAFT_483831 [Parathielavia hyrcaniae]|uniref:Uncharacterized protein n=1 Tax=Parathielavia hyrcaniae TaxID=113614 RepID=A0AAN6T5J4_9PEZI|nr:hypothetical protein N658DRAFT_483831 [Parathielavia hyrcaniae]